jgi:hypothetical protein
VAGDAGTATGGSGLEPPALLDLGLGRPDAGGDGVCCARTAGAEERCCCLAGVPLRSFADVSSPTLPWW